MLPYEVFFFALLFFILGILFFNLNLGILVFIFNVLIFLGFLVSFLILKNKKFLYLAFLSFLILGGALYVSFYSNSFYFTSQKIIPLEIKGLITKIINTEPHLLFVVHNSLGNFLVQAYPTLILKEGEEIVFLGKGKEPTALPTYFQKEKIVAYYSYPQIISIGESNSFYGKLLKIKNNLVNQVKFFLPQKEATFLAGLLFGVKNNFSSDFNLAMKKSGTTHLVALSGYNISIVVVFFMMIFTFFLPRFLSVLGSVLGVIIFVLMTGAESSVVRAAIMGILILFANEKGHLFDVRNIIILSAFLMLIFNPYLLVFDVGFELSFLALVGIVYLKPLLFYQTQKEKAQTENFFNWKDAIQETISAQVLVFPLLLNTFGYFSLVSILSNALILWLIPITMFLGFLSVGAGLIFKFLGMIFSWLVFPLLKIETFIIEFFGSLNFGLQWKANFWFFVLYYLILGILILWPRKFIKIF